MILVLQVRVNGARLSPSRSCTVTVRTAGRKTKLGLSFEAGSNSRTPQGCSKSETHDRQQHRIRDDQVRRVASRMYMGFSTASRSQSSAAMLRVTGGWPATSIPPICLVDFADQYMQRGRRMQSLHSTTARTYCALTVKPQAIDVVESLGPEVMGRPHLAFFSDQAYWREGWWELVYPGA